MKRPIPQVFRTPSQRVSKVHWKKLAKSRLQFLLASFYFPELYCKSDMLLSDDDDSKSDMLLYNNNT